MNIEELTEYCQSLKFVTTEILWGDVLVFKVGGKMFCFAPMDEGELKMNLKCDPEEAIELRERFPAVLPGYHMNKSVSVIETIQKRSEAFGGMIVLF